MSRLFLFAIGGTGARVVKSLTMLLAAGVKLKNTQQVIPILMDPHAGNLDLKRTKALLSQYQAVRSALPNPPREGLFSTDIQTLKTQVPTSTVSDTFVFELKGVTDETFDKYIGLDTLDKPTQALARLLFSQEQLATKMDIGFVGNPNIGSVVLNQFEESEEFKAFAAAFKPEDRVFIISSIFGGTGAAGFPIILKNIRGYDGPERVLRRAVVGAVSVQPYFDVYSANVQGNLEIDNATFISKTKAALNYYQSSLSSSDYPKLNALYYLGEAYRSPYEYDPGRNGQQNDAHFLEMIAALSVIDFTEISGEMENEEKNGQLVARNPRYREFGLHTASGQLNFTDFKDKTAALTARPLAKLALLSHYLNSRLEGENLLTKPQKPAWLKNNPAPEIGPDFRSTRFYRQLKDFDAGFQEWLWEMNDRHKGSSTHVPDRSRGNDNINKRSFKPFEFGPDLYQFVRGYEKVEKGFLGFGGAKTLDWEGKNGLDELINEESKNRTFATAEEKFMGLMDYGTGEFIKRHFDKLPS